MKNHYKEIADQIESGEYFLDAKDWYLKKYIYSFVERSYLILFLAIGLILGGILYSYYSSLQPIVKDIPLAVAVSDSDKFYSEITYLGNKQKNFDINKLVTKYIAKRFAESFESYDYNDNFKKLRTNMEFIKISANEELLKFYESRISIKNIDSLILKYRKHTRREVYVDQNSIRIESLKNDNDSLKFAITLNFIANEVTKEATTTSNWQAKIDLSFDSVKYNWEERKFNDLKYKVNSYESKFIN
jgi:type IV secretory pathway component VirB8